MTIRSSACLVEEGEKGGGWQERGRSHRVIVIEADCGPIWGIVRFQDRQRSIWYHWRVLVTASAPTLDDVRRES